eukprot:606703-Rhodomonas_salina.1
MKSAIRRIAPDSFSLRPPPDHVSISPLVPNPLSQPLPSPQHKPLVPSSCNPPPPSLLIAHSSNPLLLCLSSRTSALQPSSHLLQPPPYPPAPEELVEEEEEDRGVVTPAPKVHEAPERALEQQEARAEHKVLEVDQHRVDLLPTHTRHAISVEREKKKEHDTRL